jgi:hypothetical protein
VQERSKIVDQQRFDVLARTVASDGSRRGVLQGLMGALSIVALGRSTPRVAVQADELAPGDPCQYDTQCVAGGTSCDYVGATDDYRCCGYVGDRCAGDESCCGWLVCPPGGQLLSS